MWLIIQLLQHDLQWSLWSRHCRAKGLHLQQDLSLSLSYMEILFYVAKQGFRAPRPFPNLQAPYLAPMNRSNTFHLSQSIRIFHWAVIGGKELPITRKPVILQLGTSKDMGAYQAKPSVLKETWEHQGVVIDSLIFLLLKVAMAQTVMEISPNTTLSFSFDVPNTPWYSMNRWSKDNQNELCHVSLIKISNIYTCIYIIIYI